MAVTTVEVEVDVDDVIENISDSTLIAEIISREISTRKPPSVEIEEFISALDESACLLRKQGRADLAFRLDELRREL